MLDPFSCLSKFSNPVLLEVGLRKDNTEGRAVVNMYVGVATAVAVELVLTTGKLKFAAVKYVVVVTNELGAVVLLGSTLVGDTALVLIVKFSIVVLAFLAVEADDTLKNQGLEIFLPAQHVLQMNSSSLMKLSTPAHE